MASAQDLQPTCEDYDSDQSEQGHVFPGRSSPNAANVSTKRSQASDLNKEKPPAPPQDLRSDSGYSSYTAATVSSTNSAQSASSHRSPPAAPSPPAPAAAAVAAHPQAPPPPPPQQQQKQPQQQPTPPPTKTSRRLTQSDQSRPKLSSRTTSQSSSKPVVKQRRPTITQDPRPEPTTRRRDSRVESECNDPKCTSCPPSAVPARLARPSLKPNQSARDVDRVSTADTRSMRSDPATYYPSSPPSPNQARRPAAYRQESAIIQPAKAPRRPSASRPRPMSYSGEPNPQYWAQGAMPAPYPSPPQEHGPPLSNSAAWRHMPQYHAGGMPPYAAPQGYPGAYYTHTPPPYDGGLQRPGMPARINSARNGPGPIVTQYPRDQQYSARHNQPQSAVQTRFPQALQLQEQAYESESESETGSSDDDDYYVQQPDPNDPRNQRALVAPAKLERTKSKSTSKKSQRPPIRHANTTQVVDERAARRMSLSQSQPQSLVIDQTRRKRASRPTEELSRRASVSRPSAPSRQVQSDYPDHRGQMVVAKSVKAERRRSGQVYEQSYHPDERRSEAALKKARALARAEAKRAEAEEEARYQAEQAEIAAAERKRANRHSRQYSREPQEFYSDDNSETEESDEEQFLPEAPVPPPPQARRRRPTDAGNGKGKERVLERKTKRIENEAEEYISARRGAREPFNETIHNAARHSRTISMPSHSGSSGSERSRSNRTAITNENNEIRLRVDANAPLSLQFNGDMEGRTLRMIPAENGMADLVISGGRETAYHNSDRGSNADDRKALALRQPRRQAEEMTENSSRPRRRRDSQVIRETRVERSAGQRPLRQRAHTASYYNE